MELDRERRHYTSWYRANTAFYWCYGVPILEKYTEEDGEDASERAVRHFLNILYWDGGNKHPIGRKYNSIDDLLEGFDKKYPKSGE